MEQNRLTQKLRAENADLRKRMITTVELGAAAVAMETQLKQSRSEVFSLSLEKEKLTKELALSAAEKFKNLEDVAVLRNSATSFTVKQNDRLVSDLRSQLAHANVKVVELQRREKERASDMTSDVTGDMGRFKSTLVQKSNIYIYIYGYMDIWIYGYMDIYECIRCCFVISL